MFVELRDRIVSRHRSGEGYQNISAVLNVSKNTVASIILKWKKFGTNKTLPRSGHTAKLGNRGRRADGHSDRALPSPLWRRRTNISAAVHQSDLCGRVARQKPLHSKRHMTAHLEFAKRHLKTLRPRETRILLGFFTRQVLGD